MGGHLGVEIGGQRVVTGRRWALVREDTAEGVALTSLTDSTPRHPAFNRR
jgi:hypothetical protein